jgi:hypothetical protein
MPMTQHLPEKSSQNSMLIPNSDSEGEVYQPGKIDFNTQPCVKDYYKGSEDDSDYSSSKEENKSEEMSEEMNQVPNEAAFIQKESSYQTESDVVTESEDEIVENVEIDYETKPELVEVMTLKPSTPQKEAVEDDEVEFKPRRSPRK